MMKIKVVSKVPVKILFSKLFPGDCFRIHGHIATKISGSEAMYLSPSQIGVIIYINPDTVVQPMDLTISARPRMTTRTDKK